MAVQGDGKFFAFGFTDNGGGNDWDFALARFEGGACPIKLPNLGNYVAYNIFVHPQDLVGPPVPPWGPVRIGVDDQSQIGPAVQLSIRPRKAARLLTKNSSPTRFSGSASAKPKASGSKFQRWQ